MLLTLPALLVARQVYIPRYPIDTSSIVRVLVNCEEDGSEYTIFRLVSLIKLPSLSQTIFGMGTPLARQVKECLSPTVAVLC